MNYEFEINQLKQRIEQLEKILQQTTSVKAEKTTTSNRDKTKYMFEGKVFAKNRLVLAVIKKYIEKHNPKFLQLSSVFDKSLQGSLNVVEKLENAEKISDGAKRYFMKPEDIISLKDNVKVVVCTQWGAFNIGRFVKQAESLGFNIDLIK